jgi:capsular polysaccharide transport system ATP-binding protein
MIEFRDVSKVFRTPNSRKVVLDRFSLSIPTGTRVALLGRNGAGKSTMIGMVAGTVRQDRGQILRRGSVSWPLGFSGSFAPEMTGAQNTRFVARIYGMDTDELLEYVEEFAELGDFINMPVRVYSSGMRARLAFGLSMGINFDWYLVDEITAVGDAAFREKSMGAFRRKLDRAGLFMVSHAMPTLRDFCSSGLLLDEGQATYFPVLEDAIRAYSESIRMQA